MAHVLHPTTTFDQVMARHPDGFDIILVMRDGVAHGYRNSCPHVGVGLDWGDGRCLSGENELQCSLHGARFAADTGVCTSGPCYGDALERVPIRIEDGRVVCDVSDRSA
jgi:nitrite reductase/ring-hydroxylating ferredoxin subunit